MTAVLIAVGVLLLLTSVTFGITLALSNRRSAVTLRRTPEGFVLHTPRGRARARLVLHEDMGRVYEVRWRDGSTTYCPPTPVLLMRHAERHLSTDR